VYYDDAAQVLVELFHARCSDVKFFNNVTGRVLYHYPRWNLVLAAIGYNNSDNLRMTEMRHGAAGSLPGAQTAGRKGAHLPHAWRVRGLTEAELCLSSYAYAVLLEMWEYAGGDPKVDDLFVAAVREASYEAWDDEAYEHRPGLCVRPKPSPDIHDGPHGAELRSSPTAINGAY
jgi:hypothetical protein